MVGNSIDEFRNSLLVEIRLQERWSSVPSPDVVSATNAFQPSVVHQLPPIEVHEGIALGGDFRLCIVVGPLESSVTRRELYVEPIK